MGYPGNEEFHLNEEVQLVMDQMKRSIQKIVMQKRTLPTGFHHVHLQVLPPKWKFPIITCKQLIDNWYVGNKRENIPPLEVLSALHVAHLGTPGNRNSRKVKGRKIRCVM